MIYPNILFHAREDYIAVKRQRQANASFACLLFVNNNLLVSDKTQKTHTC